MRVVIWGLAAGAACGGFLLLGQEPGAATGAALHDIFSQFTPKVSTRRDARTLWVESDGLPAHRMMVGITAWQQQVPLPQRYVGDNAWPIPLNPVPAKQPLSARERFFRGAIAVAANGIPIFNPIKNDGRTDTFLAGELDEFGGHCGRADDYHYHIAPTHLQSIVGPGKPVAFALDGYAIFGFTEPDGSAPKDLDAFNGHETPALGYHYHASRTYPYVNGGFHGQVTERGGQVDPQPSATPVRPALPPLRGATITGFTNRDDRAFQLDVRVGKATHVVRYALQTNGAVDFEFVDGQGNTRRESYQLASPNGGGPGAPNDGPRRRRKPGAPGQGNGNGPDSPRREPPQAGQPRQPWLRVHAEEMDSNADGALSKAEIDAEVARTWKALDANADGVLVVAERRGQRGQGSAMAGFVDQHWDEVDANADGRVSRDEFAAVAQRMFQRGDADRDGTVSAEELKSMQAAGGRAGRKTNP